MPTDLIEDIVDDAPGKALAAPEAVAVTDRPARKPRKGKPARPAKDQGEAEPANDEHPHGYLVKHPGYGALRISTSEAKTKDEAIEAYRKRRRPHLELELLQQTGLRFSVLPFVPADTER